MSLHATARGAQEQMRYTRSKVVNLVCIPVWQDLRVGISFVGEAEIPMERLRGTLWGWEG